MLDTVMKRQYSEKLVLPVLHVGAACFITLLEVQGYHHDHVLVFFLVF